MRSPIQRFFLLFFLTTASSSEHDDIPMKKAMPPDMDPLPTLPEITHRVYFDITGAGHSHGRVVFGLFGHHQPRLVENFRTLAVCSKLCYKQTKLHRIIPHFGLQGGDIIYGDGTGGESIYGGRFEINSHHDVDNNYLAFHQPYLLAMASTKQHGSQFFINSVKTQWLTGKHPIFGMVLEGKDVLKELEVEYGTYGGTPTEDVLIVACGELPLEPQDAEVHYA